jgi:hypothetical protein
MYGDGRKMVVLRCDDVVEMREDIVRVRGQLYSSYRKDLVNSSVKRRRTVGTLWRWVSGGENVGMFCGPG